MFGQNDSTPIGYKQPTKMYQDAKLPENVSVTEFQLYRLETVSVAAGTFRTCAISEGSQKANLGVVPFGLVKYNDPTANVELVSFTFGKQSLVSIKKL